MQVLVFQHTPSEHPAAFTDLAKAAGDQMTVVHLYLGDQIPALDPFDALLVMGGPMDVWDTDAHPWLLAEKTAIRDWVRAGRPYLGICLGHQLLADAMGGACAKMAAPEIGVPEVTQMHHDPMLAALPQSFPTMQWHAVAVTQPPRNTTILATGKQCANQAMRTGHCAWGVQFHPEITTGLVTGWMQDDANWDCAVDWLGSPAKARDFGHAAEAHVPAAMAQSASLYAGLRAAI